MDFIDKTEKENRSKAIEVWKLSTSALIDRVESDLAKLDDLQANFPESLETEDPEYRLDLDKAFKALNRAEDCLQDFWNLLNSKVGNLI